MQSQWTVDSGQWTVVSKVECGEWRVESGEWRLESVVRAGEEAPGERSSKKRLEKEVPPIQLDYTTEFHWKFGLVSLLID